MIKRINLTKIFFSLIVMIYSFLCISCGLDVYYILEPPELEGSPADNALSRVFTFRTNDAGNSSMDIFIGTSVFYKIYNNQSSLTSDQISISSSNTQYSDSGYNKLSSLGYQQLVLSTDVDPLIEKSTVNRSIEIRLFTEGSTDNPYLAGVKVSGNYLKDGSANAIPLRINDKTFQLYSTNKTTTVNNYVYTNTIPLNSDEDVKYSTTFTTDDTWYVNAYAVSVGRTSTFTLKYSQLTALGSIVISKTSF